ncbi:MAG: pilus assembly protein PilM [Gammaproteobacteria bacterium]|nr:pilus assembly protein PilM [Gammaproteobacteria bacterium]MCW5583675.1 pilus assembly protein PilM [Gammaproteobacteria bacterium]
MMRLFSFKSSSLIGIDIQTHEVRIVQLRKIKHGFLIEHIATSKLSAGVFLQGKVKEWDALSVVLTELTQSLGLSATAVVISLPANLVIMQQIQLPCGMTEAAIEAEIRAQIEQDFPGINEMLCIDFHVSVQEKQEYLDILFAAARQAYVMQYVQCIASMGLKVKIVDIDVYALRRIFSFALPFLRVLGEPYAIVCENNCMVSFVIFNANQAVFHQQWETSGAEDFFSQLKNRIQIFRATFHYMELRKLAIYSASKFDQIVVDDKDFNSMIEVFHPNLFASIMWHERVKPYINQENSGNFLLACGLAMCEVPQW